MLAPLRLTPDARTMTTESLVNNKQKLLMIRTKNKLTDLTLNGKPPVLYSTMKT